MKLALVRRRFTQSGGAENYTARLAEGLCAAGYDVHLVCESWKKESPITTPYTVCELGPTGSPSAFADLADAFFANHPFDFVFSLERIHRCDLYRAGDGVHQKWLSIKNEGRRFAAFLDGLNPKHRQILLLEKELLARKGARHIIANSQTGAEEIQSLYGRSASDISVVHNGVDFEKFSQGNPARIDSTLSRPPGHRIILLVGSGWKRKGIGTAIEAVKLLRREHRVTLLVLGRDLPYDLHPEIAQFAPPTATPEDYYAAADVFLLPSLYEPFSNACLEALAAGLPVVTSRINGAAEVITPETGAILENPRDPAGIANALRPFLVSEKLEAVKPLAQKLAREYSLERNLRETIRVIESVALRP